jgi:hypothetical protein
MTPEQCAASELFQDVFKRYAKRLAIEVDGTPVTKPQPDSTVIKDDGITNDDVGSKSQHWWRLNTTNCDQHDLHNESCRGMTIDDCQAHCELIPDCGGFLYYENSKSMALKNTTCSHSIAPLPCDPAINETRDCNDSLYVLMAKPQPAPASDGILTSIEVCISDSSTEELSSLTNESYTLDVPAAPASAVIVTAASIFGAMRALETFTQLTDVRMAKNATKAIHSTPVRIADAPRYPFRGLMIDSARHFLPVEHVKRVIHAASLAKLNVIHWHLR